MANKIKNIILIILLLFLTSYRPFGDTNGDYKVDIMDLYITDKIVKGMESAPLQRLRSDLNCDGIVDELDLKILHTYILYK